MCGRTTNVTNTGLGDDQFTTLTGNQSNIGNSVDGLAGEASEGFATINTGLTGVQSGLDSTNTNMTSGFTNLQDTLAAGATLANTNFGATQDLLNRNNANTQTNSTGISSLSDNVNTGFSTMGGRFDNVDQNTANVQTTVDQVSTDQAQGFSDVNSNLSSGFDAASADNSASFAAAGEALNEGFTTAGDERFLAAKGSLEGQRALGEGLTTLGSNMNAYEGESLTNQAAMQSTQDNFQSNFDDYVSRYSDDTTLANQTRADLQTAQSNSADRIREDVGNFAQDSSTGNANISSKLSSVANNASNAIDTLGSTVEGGFSEQSTEQQISQQNLVNNMSDVRSLLQTTGSDLDASTRSQYERLSNSFDDNGNLIRDAVDAQGNTLARSLDEQGSVIETSFNAAGQQVGQVSMNVDQMLSDAGEYKENLSSQINQAQQSNEQGFATVQQGMAAQSATTDTRLDQMLGDISTGFNSADNMLDKQVRDLASVSSGMTDLDVNMRQNFNHLGSSFDDSGQLLQNSIDEQGNAISRAVDTQGNLLLRSFDATGRRIGDKVININKTLSDLSKIRSMPGANISMGNLTPAMQGSVPTGGFMSPFSQTR